MAIFSTRYNAPAHYCFIRKRFHAIYVLKCMHGNEDVRSVSFSAALYTCTTDHKQTHISSRSHKRAQLIKSTVTVYKYTGSQQSMVYTHNQATAPYISSTTPSLHLQHYPLLTSPALPPLLTSPALPPLLTSPALPPPYISSTTPSLHLQHYPLLTSPALPPPYISTTTPSLHLQHYPFLTSPALPPPYISSTTPSLHLQPYPLLTSPALL